MTAAELPTVEPHVKLAEALVVAQAEMPAVEPDKENPHFRSKFISLGHLLSKVRPVLNKHGLAVVQAPALDQGGNFVLRTTIMHCAGATLSFDAPLAPVKNDPQGQGSAITYMRRYALAAALAIADQEDDDGNAASAPAASTPASSTNGDRAPGKPSQKQFDFLESLAREAGFLDTELSTLMAWAAINLTGGKEGSCSRAINGLKDSDQAVKVETADRLRAAAKEWAATQSDLPADTSGLEVESHPEDESIPF